MAYLEGIGRAAKAASRALAPLGKDEKNRLLTAIAQQVRDDMAEILAANAKDVAEAGANGIPEQMIDRLRLDEDRIRDMADAVDYVVTLADPIGEVIGGGTIEQGMRITKVRVPLGVVGMIYESRPNVTLDTAALCLKSGNAVILKGGKEAAHSNKAIVKSIRTALEKGGINPDCVCLIEQNDRAVTTAFMKLNEYIDVLIPRGGAGLIRAVVENATVPVIETGTGVCHIYVEKTADEEMALDICHNAKTSRVSVCNSAETILVDRAIAGDFLPKLAKRLEEPYTEIYGCAETVQILGNRAMPADEDTYFTEHLDYKVSIKVVEGVQEAIDHIEHYSTHHSDAVVTRDTGVSNAFTAGVDSAAVYVNASTRFTDGGVFGLGAEIGISTQKLHARGPMGLNALTSYKFIVLGDGQIR